MTSHLEDSDGQDDSAETPSSPALTQKDMWVLAGVALLLCSLTAVAFANGSWFLGILLLIVAVPAAVIATLVLCARPSGAVLFATLVVTCLALVISAHISQEQSIDDLYVAECEASRSGNMGWDRYDEFGGWAVRDRSFDEVTTWSLENCPDDSGQEPSSGETQDDRSEWSDCGQRIWAVTRYEGFTDEEEREAIAAIRADCDSTPGTADW